MIYYLYKTEPNISQPNAAYTVDENTNSVSFVFDPANTDYQNFKKQINADEAQLEDADGSLMTSEQAKSYVATLP